MASKNVDGTAGLQVKLEKAAEKNRTLNEQLRGSRARAKELEKALEGARQSEDFTKLVELYKEVDVLNAWHRDVQLPFGKFRFTIRGGYIDVVLEGVKPDKSRFTFYGDAVVQLVSLRDAINETSDKLVELEKLKGRIKPLADIVTATSNMIMEHSRRETFGADE